MCGTVFDRMAKSNGPPRRRTASFDHAETFPSPFTPPVAACPKHSTAHLNRQHHLRQSKTRRFQANTAKMLFALELLFAFILPLVAALKFDIQAHPGHESASKERCIRNFVAKDQLVVVTATASGSRGDGQTLNMHVSCTRVYCVEEEHATVSNRLDMQATILQFPEHEPPRL